MQNPLNERTNIKVDYDVEKDMITLDSLNAAVARLYRVASKLARKTIK